MNTVRRRGPYKVVDQERQHMNAAIQDRRDHTFLIGLVTGTFVGAGLAIWLVPRAASEWRQRMTDSARELSRLASDRYQQVSARAEAAVDDLTTKGQTVRDGMADAVVRGAGEVARHATALKTDHAADAKN
jgi:gas vesicle protein